METSKWKVLLYLPPVALFFFCFDVPRFVLFFLFPLCKVLFLTAFKILLCLVFRILNMICLMQISLSCFCLRIAQVLESAYLYLLPSLEEGIYINATYICVYICIYASFMIHIHDTLGTSFLRDFWFFQSF